MKKTGVLMETGEFETLSKKVEQAVVLIEELKRERDALKRELAQKSENMVQAGDRVRDLVSRLEAALA